MNLKSNVPTCYINYIFHLRITLLFLFLFYSIINLIFMTLFLAWGIKHRNKEAVSILFSQIWFAFSWLLDQLCKLCLVSVSTYFNVLKDKFKT